MTGATMLEPPGISQRPIAATKLAVPAPMVAFTVRGRLDDLLTRGAAGPVTTVCAPPGSGKTFLVAAWVAAGHAPGPVAWVSLDPDDDAPGALWSWIAAAFERATGRELELGDPADAPGAFTEAVARLDGPLVLVLDDLQVLSDPEVLHGLRVLLRRPPPGLRVLLLARAAPPLPLHRLRLAGDLTEIGPTDLAFTPEEAGALLAGSGLDLAPADLATLTARTEGWAAGLRLAALSLARADDPHAFVADFGGSERNVADYLQDEVLSQLPGGLAEFLLRTSVPERLTVELAAALAGRLDAAELLAELERMSLFVSRQRGNGETVFRYHHFFHEFLRDELERRHHGELPALNRTAAEYLERRGEVQQALRHAFASGDWDYAAGFVGRRWFRTVSGAPAALAALIAAVPEGELDAQPELGLLAAVDHLNRGERAAAERRSRRAAEAFERLPPEREAAAEPVLLTLRLYAAHFDTDADAVAAAAEELLARASGYAGERHARARAMGLVNRGMVRFASGDLDGAEESFEEAVDLVGGLRGNYTALNALGHLAVIAVFRGRLGSGLVRGREALVYAEEWDLGDVLHAVPTLVALGWAELLRSDLASAGRYADRATGIVRAYGYPYGRAVAALLNARVLGTGAPESAERGLRRLRGARADIAAAPISPPIAGLSAGVEARLRAVRGDGLDRALDSLERDELATPAERDLLAARLYLSAGETRAARERLDAALAARPLRHPALDVEALVLDALLVARHGGSDAAAPALEEALALAAVDAYRRPFVEGGPAVEELLRAQIRRGTAQRAFAGELVAVLGGREPGADVTTAELVEPLSAREQAVLRYLPTMMSNDEIARELYLSVNTVKTHLRHVYRKLGADGRRDAVRRGRSLGLL